MSHFEIDWKATALPMKEVFTISRSSRTEVPVVFLTISKDGYTGFGEASPNSRYNESTETVVEFIKSVPDGLLDVISSEEELAEELDKLPNQVQSAKTAIEMAWLDWWAKSKGQPLWKLWGEKSPVGPVTSYTIGIDTPQKMQEKIRQAEQYPVYKIKLGTDHDRELIEAIREVTDKPLRVDANEGWKTITQAKKEIEYLADQNVELIEQPMSSSLVNEMFELKQWSPLPLCADESFTGNEDLQEISKAFHIINIKLMKIGSLSKARRVIEEAHQLGLEVMIGCMIESSLANAAGALLALKADYADLDGHLLIADDPFSGLTVDQKGHLHLSSISGLGVNPRN